MWNDSSNFKQTLKFAFIIVMILFYFNNFNITTKKCFATESDSSVEEELEDGVEDILNDIDSTELDDYLIQDFDVDFLNKTSFKDIVVSVLSGNYFDEYDSLFDGLLSIFKDNLKGVLSLIIALLAMVFLSEMFKNFCADKFSDFKKLFQIVFSILIVLVLANVLKDVVELVENVVQKIFQFSNTLFPILLNLILLSGASGSFSIYSSLSVFLLNTGSYIFVYVLLPLSTSILVLSLIGSIFSNNRFSKTIDIFKTIFKYIIGLMFGVFGLFSMVNLMVAGTKDGVGLKLTKYAIKNYIPILGGYISDGFDFVHACSVLVKNAFGVCGVIVLFFMVLKPLIVYFVYLIAFKVLSLIVSYVGVNSYSDMFDGLSKSMGYFVAVLVGVFLIMFVFVYLMIVSVSVV